MNRERDEAIDYLEPSEQEVVRYFRAELDPDWEVYAQPHLNGLRPDLIVLHPAIGIGIFEIKDWKFEELAYRYEADAGGDLRLVCNSPKAGGRVFVRKDPVDQLIAYRAGLFDLFCPSLGARLSKDKGILGLVTLGLICPRAPDASIARVFGPALADRKLIGKNGKPFVRLVGMESLARGIEFFFPESRRKRDLRMTAGVAADLRSWLGESEEARESRQPLQLSAKQRDVARTRTATGLRRVKGSAGSGKSQALAARAAHLALEGRKVLVVSYNITLVHYLRDLAGRYLEPSKARRAVANHVTFAHFHGFCNLVCDGAGLKIRRQALLRAEHPDRNTVFERLIPELAEEAVDWLAANRPEELYDAVLVDEGQDFNLAWWKLLRKAVRSKDGEMLLVADRTQDIYGRSTAWTEEKMDGAGFRGEWMILDVTFRLPEDWCGNVREYATRYLAGKDALLPESTQYVLFKTQSRWLQVRPAALVDTAVEAIKSINGLRPGHPINFSDVVFLAPSKGIGARISAGLRSAGLRVSDTFGDGTGDRSSKFAFYSDSPGIKGTTIHSFKGWESTVLVIIVDRCRSDEDRALLYVALTRLRRCDDGSAICVVCSDDALADYGRSFSQFEFRAGGSAAGRP